MSAPPNPPPWPPPPAPQSPAPPSPPAPPAPPPFPTASGERTLADDVRRSRTSRRGAAIGVLVVVAAAVGLALWLWARNDSDDGRTVPTSAAPTTAATAPATTAAAPTTAPPATTTPATPSSSAATVPSVPPLATTTPPTPSPPGESATLLPGAAPPGSEGALGDAQAVAGALADGDWAAVRRVSPTDTRTVAELEAAYGALSDVTLVPARVVRSGDTTDLRLGLVAHEDHASGPTSAVLCAHWVVHEATGTVDRVSSVRLRLEPGHIDPASVAAELVRVCANYPLR